MNDLNPDLDDVVDRIVDGGLSPRELRAAVARLDASPDHWRRCALAFIEARTLGEVLRESDEARPSSREVIPIRRNTVVVRRLAYAASLAAMALGLGWFGAGHGVGGHGAAGVDTGTVSVSTTRPSHRSEAPGVERGTVPSAHVLGAGLPTPPEPPTEGLIAEEQTTMAFEDWLRDQPPPISSYEQAALEREGYRVEQRREIVLGTLDDGRLAAVPVDEVQVEYVGHLSL